MYTILHLENSEFIKRMVRDILVEKGYNYISVDTSEKALEVLNNKQMQVDLIITSMLIIDDDIENFMRNVNIGDNKKIPVFVITGNDVDEYKKRVLNLGVSDYITKDNLVNELLKHVEVVAQEDELMNSLKNAKITVVDDSKLDIQVITDILKKYEVKHVDYFETGKALLDTNKKYDLYLVDIVLQKEFGRNIILNIRRNNLDASIIIVSSLTNTKTLSSILNAGANDYIRKPLSEDIFIAKLKSNIRVLNLINKIKDSAKISLQKTKNDKKNKKIVK